MLHEKVIVMNEMRACIKISCETLRIDLINMVKQILWTAVKMEESFRRNRKIAWELRQRNLILGLVWLAHRDYYVTVAISREGKQDLPILSLHSLHLLRT